MRNIVVYIAGPFRADTHWGIAKNVRKAEEAALEVWKAGFTAICPHLNTAHFQGELPDEEWLEGDLEIILRCDAVLLIPGWTASKGSVGEWDHATFYCIPTFTSLEELKRHYGQSDG